MSDVTPEQGRAIVAAAAAWKGTPYKFIGAASRQGSGGDCSGSTWQIYKDAGLPYNYQTSATFTDYVARTGRFREVGTGKARQEGDVLYWPGHMAIYSGFAADAANRTTSRLNKKNGAKWTQFNDMWSATKPGGGPYGPSDSKYRSPPPRVFRYVQ